MKKSDVYMWFHEKTHLGKRCSFSKLHFFGFYPSYRARRKRPLLIRRPNYHAKRLYLCTYIHNILRTSARLLILAFEAVENLCVKKRNGKRKEGNVVEI